MNWGRLFKENIINGGQDYINSNSVLDLKIFENEISATVDGLEKTYVNIRCHNNEITDMQCTCPYGVAGNNCRHMAAVLLAWEKKNSTLEDISELIEANEVEKVQIESEIDGINNEVVEPETLQSDSVVDEIMHPEGQHETTFKKAKEGIEFSAECDDIITYAIQQHGVKIVRDVCIKNTTDVSVKNLVLKISSDTALLNIFEEGVQELRAGEEIHLRGLKVRVNADYLASLTERISCNILLDLLVNDEKVISDEKEIVALAFDQWPGLKYTPELLTAFSMPNHPVVTSLIQLASKYMEKWTGDPSLAGYQYDDANRVKQMAAATYAAIQQKNITYANPPSSFEIFGQRIRLADAVLEQHLGTCMDMTLLYVACLEAMGLNPVMVLIHGHIFAGVWLVDDSFSDTIMDDPSHLQKRMASGINEMLVVECTAMCAGKTCDFDKAVKRAENNVADYGSFEFVIDVIRARSMGIRPLPVRVKTDAGFIVQHIERKETDITSVPNKVGKTFDLSGLAEKEKVTKQLQWERKLLDLSMRNMLINLRFTKAVVPLLCSNVGILEDVLSDGEELQILPKPDNMGISGDGIPIEALTDLGPFTEFIELESKHRKLHAFYTEKELNSCLTKMYRSAKTSLEENGASTLYLTLGLLRWTEGKKNPVIRYAPIILVPIDIIRKSASKGYTMRMRDEDAQINITLLEFLKQNYDIYITGLNPLPSDEHGLDLPKIFAIIRHGIMNLDMWDVIEAGFIGNFSFSQFVMWNDIHNRSDMLEKNNIVRSLMKGAVDWDCTIPESVDTDEAYLPINADASQFRAINMAANDVSFVLHGPPGTGKSQTITAMIANALIKGKTILFVAEKMAALEVVRKRLAAIGIDDFCLELHSNKATKKAVLDQLKKTLEIGVWGMSTDYDTKIEDIRNMRKDLDAYVEKLHERRGFGKSLRELIDIYEIIPDHDRVLRFSTEYASTLSQSDLDNQKRVLEQLIAVGKGVGHPCGHPLSGIGQTVYTQTLRMDLEEKVTAYKNSLEAFEKATNAFVTQLQIEKPVSEVEWMDTCALARSVISLQDIPSVLINAQNIDKEFDYSLLYVKEKSELEQKKNGLLMSWQEPFLQMDMEEYRTRLNGANKKLFGKGKAIATIVAEIQSFAKFTIVPEQIPVMLAFVEQYQKLEKDVLAKQEQIAFEWRQIIDRYVSVEELEKYKVNVKKQLQMVSKLSGKISNLEKNGTLADCMENGRLLLSCYNKMSANENAVVNLLAFRFEHGNDNWLLKRKAVCDVLTANTSVIKDWIMYRQFEAACRNVGLDVVCDAYEAGLLHDDLMDIYLKSIYQAIILSVIEREPILNCFTGNSFNERVVQFKKLDAEFMELTKEEMYYKLTHQLPTGYEDVQISKELNILRRAISSNGRGISIRTLFDQIPHVLQRLCPCMLMSPISVAQYLSADNDPYDIVIFDEASQLPTCKAVGVLARGKNAVIVGDPNQMPPTSFFAGNTVDEDNLEIEDLDSILDDCLALGMPSTHLQWHYRSRHESLIAFSNHEFYENSMLTFPSVNDHEKRVSMIKVESFFDRKKGRVNEGEAKAIVKEIKRRYKNVELKKQTIGVVTFNISQQTLIEDLLQEEFQKDVEFDKWATVGEESLFVKNLENVQGDERDVILFSVAFGPDEEGKLSLNFGPLNKEGGWKRLNVAVSRARNEMIVFSTMTANMIDLKRTKSKGVESLKKFLEFAEKGRLQMSYAELHQEECQGILNSICNVIESAGYKYQRAVGRSKFKVDIAVINPHDESQYLLGIMLDGDSYRQSSNTKDREIAQVGMLKGLGWDLHRIWTMDWWDNKEKELSRLMTLIKEKSRQLPEMQQEMIAEDVEEDVIKTVNEEEETSKDVQDAKLLDFEEVVVESEIKKDEKANDCDVEQTAIAMIITNPVEPKEQPLVAAKVVEKAPIVMVEERGKYITYQYESAQLTVTGISSEAYVLKSNMNNIVAVLQQIINIEAPISYDRLLKKALRAFDISRSSAQTIEATEKALKKVNAKTNKQNGVKFYWKEEQKPDTYSHYRIDVADKRTMDDICQQELKNVVCRTLQEKGALSKDDLIRETIRQMGYARSGPALVEAVERGIKYARKTGEVEINEEKRFVLGK